MCLVAIAHRAHPDRPLVVAANRDEAYARPTRQAHFWDEHPQVLAGRDLEAGGTWLGIDRRGRFAAITNFREVGAHRNDAPSRGHLVGDFLCQDLAAEDYLRKVAAQAQRYNGFNLLLRDDTGLYYFSNRTQTADPAPRRLAPGVYGLSNHLLDTPWPKVVLAKQRFAQAVDAGEPLESMMEILRDTEPAPDHVLPTTGIGADRERLLSPIFIASETYGTRCSTLIAISSAKRARFIERSFGAGGVSGDAVECRFDLEPMPVNHGLRLIT
jgi:uncharacterized protein with NRDE domain